MPAAGCVEALARGSSRPSRPPPHGSHTLCLVPLVKKFTSTGTAPGQVVESDVVVVGAGPGGSTAAYHLAQAGLDVRLLEKAAFPREKVCGDGLTPRAVRSMLRMGIDTRPEAGWLRNHGLRIYGGGSRLELPWPDLATFPSYGLVRPRTDFDEMLARQAEKAGARLHERTTVVGPVLEERTDRVVGVTATGEDGAPQTYTAPLVICADGNSSRFSLALGIRKREDRPMGVAGRRHFPHPPPPPDRPPVPLGVFHRP